MSRDVYEKRGGGSKLITDPPGPDYEFHGWYCTYHRGFCHNPLDCDFIPLWRLTPDAIRAHIDLALTP